jgi:hypothetical protein
MLKLALVLASIARLTTGQTVQLPSHERLFVLQGGDTPNVNIHALAPSQAFGVDFAVVVGSTGRALA